MTSALIGSRALWNRNKLDLLSDEILAQILDRGDVHDWRDLYRLVQDDTDLQRRLYHIVLSVPLPLPHFWLALLAGLGVEVDWSAPLPDYWASQAV